MATDEYEVVWNGTLEREGRCQSLSSYVGPSSLECLVETDSLAHGQCLPHFLSGQPRRTRKTKASVLDLVLPQLRAGCSYRAIAEAAGCSMKLVRVIAADAGIDRSIFCGQGLATKRKL